MTPSYLSRRRFLQLAGMSGAGLLAGCAPAPGRLSFGMSSWAEPLWQSLLELGPASHARAKEYPRSAISREFPVRSLGLSEGYADMLSDWTLEVDGLVARPEMFDLADLRKAFAKVAQVTRHDCVEGWSAIAEWGGVRIADLLALVKPHPEARYIVFRAADADDAETEYYGSLSLRQAQHPQALLAYEMNGQALMVDHGAPLRLRVPTQLGYKSTKFVYQISLVASLKELGEGRGGYWEDQGYEHYAGI